MFFFNSIKVRLKSSEDGANLKNIIIQNKVYSEY
nr:MAG TPA: hypothetical protein [Caudoviricetes sp.]